MTQAPGCERPALESPLRNCLVFLEFKTWVLLLCLLFSFS